MADDIVDAELVETPGDILVDIRFTAEEAQQELEEMLELIEEIAKFITRRDDDGVWMDKCRNAIDRHLADIDRSWDQILKGVCDE